MYTGALQNDHDTQWCEKLWPWYDGLGTTTILESGGGGGRLRRRRRKRSRRSSRRRRRRRSMRRNGRESNQLGFKPILIMENSVLLVTKIKLKLVLMWILFNQRWQAMNCVFVLATGKFKVSPASEDFGLVVRLQLAGAQNHVILWPKCVTIREITRYAKHCKALQTIRDHEVNKWVNQLTRNKNWQSDTALELKQRVVVKNKTKMWQKDETENMQGLWSDLLKKVQFEEGQDEDVDGDGLVDVDDEVGHRVAVLHLQLALWPAVWRPILRSPWRGANHAIFLMPTRRSFLCWKSSLIMDMWSILMTFYGHAEKQT